MMNRSTWMVLRRSLSVATEAPHISVHQRIRNILERSPRAQFTVANLLARPGEPRFHSCLMPFTFWNNRVFIQPPKEPSDPAFATENFKQMSGIVSLTTGHIDPVALTTLFLRAKRAPSRVSISCIPGDSEDVDLGLEMHVRSLMLVDMHGKLHASSIDDLQQHSKPDRVNAAFASIVDGLNTNMDPSSLCALAAKELRISRPKDVFVYDVDEASIGFMVQDADDQWAEHRLILPKPCSSPAEFKSYVDALQTV
jgi:hypothetical protein